MGGVSLPMRSTPTACHPWPLFLNPSSNFYFYFYFPPWLKALEHHEIVNFNRLKRRDSTTSQEKAGTPSKNQDVPITPKMDAKEIETPEKAPSTKGDRNVEPKKDPEFGAARVEVYKRKEKEKEKGKKEKEKEKEKEREKEVERKFQPEDYFNPKESGGDRDHPRDRVTPDRASHDRDRDRNKDRDRDRVDHRERGDRVERDQLRDRDRIERSDRGDRVDNRDWEKEEKYARIDRERFDRGDIRDDRGERLIRGERFERGGYDIREYEDPYHGLSQRQYSGPFQGHYQGHGREIEDVYYREREQRDPYDFHDPYYGNRHGERPDPRAYFPSQPVLPYSDPRYTRPRGRDY